TALVGSASAWAQGGGPKGFTATPLSPDNQITSSLPKGRRSQANAQGNWASVIVKLKGEPLASYNGGVSGIPANNPHAKGKAKLDLKARESQQYRAYLKGKHDTFTARAHQAIPQAAITNDFDLVINGLAMRVPADQVAALSALPDVEAVYQDELQQPET